MTPNSLLFLHFLAKSAYLCGMVPFAVLRLFATGKEG